MLIRRFLPALLCICLFLPSVLAEEEAAPAPLTRSVSIRTDAGLVVGGTRATVDFDTVQAINPDTVGWLYQEKTLMSYPVLHNHGKVDYQVRGFDGAKLSAKGSVALEETSSLSAGTVYLQGIGRDGSCFSPLNGYVRQEYYEKHPSMRLITPEGDWQIDLFAFTASSHKDNESWRVPEDAGERSLWLNDLMTKSAIEPLSGSLPEKDERIAVLVINNKNPYRNVLFGVLRPILYHTSAQCDLVKTRLDSVETLNGAAQVGPLGTMMVYAQNDPIWDRMRYESSRNSTYRVFGGGDCHCQSGRQGAPAAAGFFHPGRAGRADVHLLGQPRVLQSHPRPLPHPDGG